MIPSVAGWRTERSVKQLALVGRDRSHGRLVYRERVRPLLKLERILEAELGPLAAGARRVALVTDEGEHAVHATAFEPDGATRHDVGLVFVDDFYACLRGSCPERSEHDRFGALVRALIAADVHGMPLRRRRFRYRPPPGWQGLARGLETHWFPPDYPRDRATITVPPANPGVQEPAAVVRARLGVDAGAGFDVSDVRSGEPIPAAGDGLPGVSFAVTGVYSGKTPFVRELAVLSDNRFTYLLLFDASGALHERMNARRAFVDVVRSVRALPAHSREVPAELVNLWSE